MKKIILPLTFLLIMLTQMDTYSQKDKETIVLIETTLGAIKVKLYNETPVHRDNFLKLVNENFYDGIKFHRVIKDFMIQTGSGETKKNADGTNGKEIEYTLPAEIVPKYFHKKGALSAARTGDNGNPMRRSSGSQFYIVQGTVLTNEQLTDYERRMNTVFTAEQREAYTTIGGTPHLDAQYTVFGEVIEGLEVVEKIAQVETAAANKPVQDITIKMKVVKK